LIIAPFNCLIFDIKYAVNIFAWKLIKPLGYWRTSTKELSYLYISTDVKKSKSIEQKSSESLKIEICKGWYRNILRIWLNIDCFVRLLPDLSEKRNFFFQRMVWKFIIYVFCPDIHQMHKSRKKIFQIPSCKKKLSGVTLTLLIIIKPLELTEVRRMVVWRNNSNSLLNNRYLNMRPRKQKKR
jgi:hypothetical protein